MIKGSAFIEKVYGRLLKVANQSVHNMIQYQSHREKALLGCRLLKAKNKSVVCMSDHFEAVTIPAEETVTPTQKTSLYQK